MGDLIEVLFYFDTIERLKIYIFLILTFLSRSKRGKCYFIFSGKTVDKTQID